MKILNLTQHNATPAQVEAGVVEPTDKTLVKKYLTFDELPLAEEVDYFASALASIAKHSEATQAMIGGAPFFMAPLERALIDVGVEPVYSFSKRVTKEVVGEDGVVKKVSEFLHEGFYRPHRQRFPEQRFPD